ncbi:hypothetical protein ACQZV8_08650 [Magnetococcales bacterium HHB-1]
MKCLLKYILVFCCVLFLWQESEARPFMMMDQAKRDRLWLGLRLFPTMIGANQQLEKKLNKDGNIHLLLLYNQHPQLAKYASQRLRRKTKTVYGHPYTLLRANQLSVDHQRVAGIFLVEKHTEEQRKMIIQYGIQHKIVTFSPFVGDVAAGILSGIDISSRIRPALNRSTIVQSKIQFNSIFYRFAKIFH